MSCQPSLGSPASIAQIPSCYPAIHHLYLWDVPVLVSHPRPFFSGLIFFGSDYSNISKYDRIMKIWDTTAGGTASEGHLRYMEEPFPGHAKVAFPSEEFQGSASTPCDDHLHGPALHGLLVTIDHTEEWESHHYHDRFVDDDQ
ncbi:hypothetical protein IAS59_002726 [Cryptococcus gattii]